MTRRLLSQELLSVMMIVYIRFICFYICFYSFQYCYIIKQDMVTFKVHEILFKKGVMMLCASMKLREHQKFKLKVKTWTLVIVLRNGKKPKQWWQQNISECTQSSFFSLSCLSSFFFEKFCQVPLASNYRYQRRPISVAKNAAISKRKTIKHN